MQLVLSRENGTEVKMEFSLHSSTVETALRENLRNVREDEYVSVKLIRQSDDETHIRDAFILQTGNDPDYKPKLDRLKPSEATPESRDFVCDTESKKDSDTFPLFFDTFGESVLLLYHCEKDGTRESYPVFSTRVSVLPSPERQRLMEETVNELLRIAPQTIRSAKDGQNQSMVSHDWSVGSASVASPMIEFDEVRKLIERLCPFLLRMIRSPAYSISTTNRRVDYERVRRHNFAIARQVERLADGADISRIIVLEKRNKGSLVSPPHAAIRNFLVMLKGRLNRIKCILEDNCRNASLSNEELESANGEGKDKWIPNKRKADMAYFNDALSRIKRCTGCVNWILSLPFWSGNEKFKTEILNVSPEYFSGNECYRFIYREITAFLRKHFWWVSLEDASNLIASLKRQNDKHGLQRKYSILYEYWCFWRMIHGFESEGFDFGAARASLRQSLARTLVIGPEHLDLAPATSGNMEIKLIHDFRAYLKEANIESDFRITEGATTPMLSPDFAIIFRNTATGNLSWMLLDAKSHDMLNETSVKKRDRYLSRITYVPESGDEGKNPEQSWLIYSGKSTGDQGKAGLEGCDDDDPNAAYNWHSCLNADTCFGDNKHNLKCTRTEGIVKSSNTNEAIKFRGHIRANAKTSPLDSPETDPFREFARIQIATAQRYLGIALDASSTRQTPTTAGATFIPPTTARQVAHISVPPQNKTLEEQYGKPTAKVPRDTGHISIYIDETWPGTQNPNYKDIGVIGGIVVPWEGIDRTKLPVIATHLSNGQVAINAIKKLRASREVFPFVFPIKWDHAVGSGGARYFELVQHALMLLLGWLLPERKRPTSVDIYLEHISGFNDGHTETDFIKSLTQAMRLVNGGRRFANLNIRRVEWVGKNFGYVPYGDLVCKTCVPNREQQRLAQIVDVRNWEGFLPVTRNIFPLLRDMDTASPAGFADLFMSFANSARDTPLFRHMRKMAIERAQSDPIFRDAIFARFEDCYAQHNRDISSLNRVVPPFLEAFSPETFAEKPRSQMLRILIGFQHANHNGDPDLAKKLSDQYNLLRPRMLALDRDLCAYIDLNLAVHHHDSFAFADGLARADAWIDDPLFPALSIQNRGRMLSSRGQSLAMMGRHAEADEAFSRALVEFGAEPELLAKDIAQAKTYRAMNLLETDCRAAMALAESLLAADVQTAAVNIAQTVERQPFVAHLFLKALWKLRPQYASIVEVVLKSLPLKASIRSQHPFELILLYLALLAKDSKPTYAQELARDVEKIYADMEFGGTLYLIHAWIRVVLKRYGLNSTPDKTFYEELEIAASYLPKARNIINSLRSAWSDSTVSVDNLPFNYC